MKIELWSDFVCPFCYIGKQRLEMAISRFPHKEEVEVIYKSFQLDPHAEAYSEKSIYEVLAAKFGSTVEQVKKMNESLIQQAAEIGLDFNYEIMKPTNTLDAHRLAKLAKSLDKEHALTNLLLKGYFTDGKNIGDPNTLLDLAEKAGIDRESASKVLNTPDAYLADVQKDIEEAQAIGVQGVPFFVVNRKYAISGAQPLETFVGALNQIWQEEHPAPTLKTFGSTDADVCADDSCAIPTPKAEN
ncbi:DsbA family oxidoreductase [Pullulanibacillus sp. KACC 23026]|uniref:DsbA family oxidoreductase n=1 Tax=Pullulanibacillus sp. KACC 23026 TaxID=3028315 RepID=UPI0023AFBD83|nr:DsbA family oxidoreductase [Pullulanibacillus sp. KACC 23026]WEG14796.1 DsbA family oxidoreductase [Pullulanibacillus sp. KACC 23026]